MKPKFGVRLPVTGPLASSQAILKMGLLADELGFDAVTTHDHVSMIYVQRYHNSGGTSELVDENERNGLPLNLFETMTTLALIAGKTQNVRLIPSSAVLPWRHPVLFAKQAVTLHELSGGRFVCSVVVGRWKTDFELMNVEFKKRGKIMDEYLEVISKMIRNGNQESSFDGRFLKLPSLESHPRPSRKLPIWIGGSFHEKVFQRVLKYGDGFMPGTMPADAFEEGIPRLKEYLKKNNRNPDELEIGAQTFLCMSKSKEEAEKLSHYTIESFFQGPEFGGPDQSDPKKTVRQVLMQRVQNSALVGSSVDVINKIENFMQAGVGFFDMRQVNRSLDDVLKMIKAFASEIIPSF